jgi:hypothetical protein
LGPAPLDPIKEARGRAARWWEILGKQHQTEGQHPEPKDRKETKYAGTTRNTPAGKRTQCEEGRSDHRTADGKNPGNRSISRSSRWSREAE